ncbi:nucleotidyltransferase family protein [Leptolinea tardivitalis]|uniref:Polymerase nucleotidyl transferase domain-containing protein n=1 Tax=Leptolinea tardivitalis TaxID=229920 RepID=A0A0P6WXJ9_9CHLR|nr:nucleotidyltransferase family protein [Leptolinea tardivitalis]KPL71007.1 hypothetical protein ADM99_11955 [Leptolinea tardivitalis]GAP22405.1 predicted nucleotidyltransferases [Leptolinea tardivitalis]
MKKNLTDYVKILEALKPLLCENFSISDIAVFGSYARGEEKPESDLDILVTYTKTPDLFDLAALNLFLEENLKIKIDLVPDMNLRPQFARHIYEEMVKIT